MELGIYRCPDSRPRIISDRRHEHLSKKPGLLPLDVPVAIQATPTCDDQRHSSLQVRFRELIKDIKDLVAKNTCEVAKFRIIYPHIAVRRTLKAFVGAQFSV